MQRPAEGSGVPPPCARQLHEVALLQPGADHGDVDPELARSAPLGRDGGGSGGTFGAVHFASS